MSSRLPSSRVRRGNLQGVVEAEGRELSAYVQEVGSGGRIPGGSGSGREDSPLGSCPPG